MSDASDQFEAEYSKVGLKTTIQANAGALDGAPATTYSSVGTTDQPQGIGKADSDIANDPADPSALQSGITRAQWVMQDGYYQCRGYVAGTTGWKLSADCTSEFNNPTLNSPIITGVNITSGTVGGATNVQGRVIDGSLSWSADGSTKTITLSATYDIIEIMFFHGGGATINLQMNGIGGSGYAYRYLVDATTINSATGTSSVELGSIGADGMTVGHFYVNGKHSNGLKSIAAAGNALGRENEHALLNGYLNGDSNDLSTISIIPSAPITGKAVFYGINL